MQSPSKSCAAKRIAAYLRVSSSRQAAEGDSLEAQRNAVNAFVTQKRSLDQWGRVEIEFYIEAGRSGKNDRRPQYQRLRSDVLSGMVDVVISVKFDRMSRNVIDLLQFRNFLSEHNVELVSIREQFDTSTPYGKFALNLLASVAEMERDLIAERTLSVMEDRARRGLWNGRPPYGYYLADGGGGHLLIDEDFAAIIREQFFNAAERLGSAGAVSRYLHDLGVVVPKHTTRTDRTFGGKPFDARQVKKVLTNRAYLGEVNWGTVQTLDAHEPIIKGDQFDRVQRLLAQSAATCSNPEYKGDYAFVLKHLVRCGWCGSAMTPCTGTGRSGRHYYYMCTKRGHKGKRGCAAPYLAAVAVDQAIVKRCIELSADEHARDQIIHDAIKQANGDARRLEKEIESLSHRATEVQREIGNLVGALRAMGETGVESVRDDLRRLEEEKSALKAKQVELQSRRDEVQSLGEMEDKFIRSWRGLGDLLSVAEPEQQQKIIRHVIEMVEWKPSKDDPRLGTYAIRFFPEAVQEQEDFLVETWPGNDDGPEGSGPLLTPVREAYTKAPRKEPSSKQCAPIFARSE